MQLLPIVKGTAWGITTLSDTLIFLLLHPAEA